MPLPDAIEVAVSIALAALAPVAYRRGGWGGLWVVWGTVATLVMLAYASYGLQLFGFSRRYPHESLALPGGAVATAMAHILLRLRVNIFVTVLLVALALAAVFASHMVVVDPLFTS
jgi:hypothetical protein